MELNPLLQDAVAALSVPGTRLRWHAESSPRRGVAGRGEIMGAGRDHHGQHYTGGLLAGHHVRKLIRARVLMPADARNSRPFSAGAPAYRDYKLQEVDQK